MARREHTDVPGSPPSAEASPWPELLAAEELSRRGFTIDELAERLGVSASYLRLVRQGKRSPSREKAQALLQMLGYQVEDKEAGSGRWDIIATDDRGRVVHVEAKARSPRPSVEEQLDRLTETANDLTKELQSVSERWMRALVVAAQPQSHESGQPSSEVVLPASMVSPAAGAVLARTSPDAPGPSWQRGLARYVAGGPRTGRAQRRSPKTATEGTDNRRHAEELLDAISDDDLPLVAAYLALVLDREGAARGS